MPKNPTTMPIFIVLIILFSLSLFPSAVRAAEADRHPFLTFYLGQGADSNLIDLFPKAVKGELEMESTNLFALGYFHPHGTPDPMQKTFDFLRIPNTRAGFEFIVGKHDGLQQNWEVDAAWQLRFAPWRFSLLNVRLGVGLGLSYAIGTPSYEDGPKDDPEKRYRFQNFNSYELEWSLPKAPAISLVTRIHHRSGMYGLIAPRRVGSNFLTIGVRYSF